MKRANNDKARHIGVRAVVAYPAASVVLVVSIALALTPFGPSQVMALGAMTAPLATTAPSATTTSSPRSTPTATTAPATATPGLTPVPTPITSTSTGVFPVDHYRLARIESPEFQASYLAVDAPVTDAALFQTFRVRFRLHNAGTDPITATPRLEYRAVGGSGYVVVPEKPQLGVPFHVTREWIPSLGVDGGTMEGPLGEDIPVADFRLGDDAGLAMGGHHSMGANPDQAITLPSTSYSEQEFTVRLSIDAQYLTGYELRITDGGTPLTGAHVATIRLGAPPAVLLSPGQRQGVTVVEPAPASSSAGAAYPLLSAQSIVATATSVSAVPAVSRPNTLALPLTTTALSTATYSSADIHGPYSVTADQCAVCHRAHVAQAPNQLIPSSQSTLCLTCHDGLGASTNVQAQYALARPVNNPVKREYYSHDALAPSNHIRSELDEFGIVPGEPNVPNRHSECADCHNSHKARANDSTPMLDTDVGGGGWTSSGRLAGVSGVSVANGAPNSAPTYKFLDGVTDLVTREYQLCLKCHSGSTTLTPNAGLKPSQYALDKGVEFNPANPSFHPVEAAGTNDTAAMTASLTKTSPYKLWNFSIGSTVRCLNCHASSGTPNASAPPTDAAAAGGSLPPHTSSNRGILLRNYLDRELKPRADSVTANAKAAYSAGDFALCYVCHGEEPFLNSSSTATNFPQHAIHLTALGGQGAGGTDIDIAGDGQGNAICAECHFRIHSTTNKVGTQSISGTRLVNFAPNVKPATPGGTVSWTQPGATASGSCTLTCHGKTHNIYNYED